MANALSEQPGSLLFKWAPRRRRRRSIVSFVIASVILHAFGFYLLQIVYPPTAAPRNAIGRVDVISPATADGRQLLRWVEAEDPAVAARTQRPLEAKTFQPPKIPHTPSFVGHQPALKMLPPHQADLRPPNAQPPGPVLRPRDHSPVKAVTAPTLIAFSPEFQGLGVPKWPEMHFARGSRDSPDAALFRVAVNSAGEIRHAILVQSSGDPALDEQSRLAITLCRFPLMENREPNAETTGLTWGTATVQWGNDIAPADSPASATGR